MFDSKQLTKRLLDSEEDWEPDPTDPDEGDKTYVANAYDVEATLRRLGFIPPNKGWNGWWLFLKRKRVGVMISRPQFVTVWTYYRYKGSYTHEWDAWKKDKRYDIAIPNLETELKAILPRNYRPNEFRGRGKSGLPEAEEDWEPDPVDPDDSTSALREPLYWVCIAHYNFGGELQAYYCDSAGGLRQPLSGAHSGPPPRMSKEHAENAAAAAKDAFGALLKFEIKPAEDQSQMTWQGRPYPQAFWGESEEEDWEPDPADPDDAGVSYVNKAFNWEGLLKRNGFQYDARGRGAWLRKFDQNYVRVYVISKEKLAVQVLELRHYSHPAGRYMRKLKTGWCIKSKETAPVTQLVSVIANITNRRVQLQESEELEELDWAPDEADPDSSASIVNRRHIPADYQHEYRHPDDGSDTFSKVIGRYKVQVAQSDDDTAFVELRLRASRLNDDWMHIDIQRIPVKALPEFLRRVEALLRSDKGGFSRYFMLLDVETADLVDPVQETVTMSTDEIAKEASKAEKPASEEHAEAGNYPKGHVKVQGLDISIENAKGSTRSGEDKNGKPWSVILPAHYGYVAKVGGETGPRGKDKDHVDCYVGDKPDGMMVFVVNQKKIDSGAFDEHKCFIGFESKDEAIKAYDKAFTGSLGPKLRKSVVSTTMDKFKEWLKSGETKKEFESLAEALLCEVEEFDWATDQSDPDQTDYVRSLRFKPVSSSSVTGVSAWRVVRDDKSEVIGWYRQPDASGKWQAYFDPKDDDPVLFASERECLEWIQKQHGVFEAHDDKLVAAKKLGAKLSGFGLEAAEWKEAKRMVETLLKV